MFSSSRRPRTRPSHGKLEPLVQAIRRLRGKGADVFIYSESPAQRERLADMMEEDEALVHLPVGWITSGFVWESVRTAILTDHEIFHRSLPRPSLRRPGRRTEGRRPDHLQVGDFVVHIDYGIGRYLGLEKVGRRRSRDGMPPSQVPRDRPHIRPSRSDAARREVRRQRRRRPGDRSSRAAPSGSGPRRRHARPSRTSPASSSTCTRRAKSRAACRSGPTRRGRGSSRRRSPSRRRRTSSRRPRKSRRTWSRRGRWTVSCAATSVSARRRSRSAPRSRR